MEKRIFIAECDGWRQKHIRYTVEGWTNEGFCSKSEWRKYEIMSELVDKGIDEKILEELYDLGYRQGSLDESDSHAGEGL
jgi:hypothetical protein